MLKARAMVLVALSMSGLSPLDDCKQLVSAGGSKGGPAPNASEGSITVPAVPLTPVLSFEEQSLKEAKQLCGSGDCQTAHERLAIALPPASPVRASADFKNIEASWANSAIAGAQNDPDIRARRDVLGQVIASPSIDAPTRERAKQTLAAMPTKPPPPLAAPSSTPAPTDYEALAVSEPKKVRDMLLPRARAKQLTRAEAEALSTACAKLKDKACSLAAAKGSH